MSSNNIKRSRELGRASSTWWKKSTEWVSPLDKMSLNTHGNGSRRSFGSMKRSEKKHFHGRKLTINWTNNPNLNTPYNRKSYYDPFFINNQISWPHNRKIKPDDNSTTSFIYQRIFQFIIQFTFAYKNPNNIII